MVEHSNAGVRRYFLHCVRIPGHNKVLLEETGTFTNN